MIGLLPGDPAPWFIARSNARAKFHFDTIAGRYVVLCFFGSAADAGTAAMLASIYRQRQLFDDEHASFFGVSLDPGDEQQRRVQAMVPGFRIFWDFDAKIAELYGLVRSRPEADTVRLRRVTVVLDPNLRVIRVLPIDDVASHAGTLTTFIAGLPRLGSEAGTSSAPVLIVPRVFEPEFCRQLIDYHERGDAIDSGFMRNDGSGKTVLVVDHAHKRRRDCAVEDMALQKAINAHVARRLRPEIRKVFQFDPSRIERHLIACYDAADGAHFSPHRDDTTKGTAHRRFAVTINLNAEEYDGGDLRFPEYHPLGFYRAPTGGAVVFSCSLLHEAMPVTRGKRYAFLPFLYDDAAAAIRLENLEHFADPDLRAAVKQSIRPVESV
jgi:peroxiredoxin/predicted 2-oxoglutarate/Fe(II)-dependent dioxygenase YbiX